MSLILYESARLLDPEATMLTDSAYLPVWEKYVELLPHVFNFEDFAGKRGI